MEVKYDPEFEKQLAELGGADAKLCFQCGTCTAGCPSGRRTSYRVRKLVRMAQLDMKDEIILEAVKRAVDYKGIKASFILTEYQGKIYISARSIDEVNVQIIMERLGGGGHISSAGAQLENVGVEEAVGVLKDTLDTMLAEEAI